MILREAVADDVEPMRAIYAHHVAFGLGSFEETVPEAEEFAGRLAAVKGYGLPWWVAEVDRQVVGYAYAGPFRLRSAYRFTAEDSVYVAPDRVGGGIGRALLGAVISACQDKGVRTLAALIGDSGNAASIALHRALGFETCGLLRAAGWKHGRWADLVIMQKALGDGDATPPAGEGWAG